MVNSETPKDEKKAGGNEGVYIEAAQYILSLSFDPCQLTQSLRYGFTRADDGAPHEMAVHGPKAGCYPIDNGALMKIQVYALCDQPDTPKIKIKQLFLSIHNEYQPIKFGKKAPTSGGYYYQMFESKTNYRFTHENCQWPLKGVLIVEIDGETKLYDFDPEVIVGRGFGG